MPSLADTDVLAAANRFLNARDDVIEALGGGGRIGARNKPPYPRARLTDPPGNDRQMRHLIAPTIQIEVLGDPDTPGQKPMLRRACYTILQALAELPELQATGAWPRIEGEPVITGVESTGGGGYVPLPPDQPRYLATLRFYAHP